MIELLILQNFKKNNLLPKFELKTIKAVQTSANEKCEFKTWFEALDSMKQQMDKIDYDIALIGHAQ